MIGKVWYNVGVVFLPSGTKEDSMNRITRILLIFMSILILSTVFVGCDAEVFDISEFYNSVDEDDDDDNASEFFPDVQRNNYGEDLNIFMAPSTNVDQFYMDEDSNDGSPMDEAVFARQEKVQRFLGIEIVKVTDPNAQFHDYHKQVQQAVLNKDGSMDVVLTHVHGSVGMLISENLLVDLGELEGMDLSAEYWNSEFMATLELNGCYFLGLSDYNLMNTYVIAFNKDMLALYDSHLDKSIYDLVRDREWTLDELISLSNLVYVDKTGDGKTEDDTYGITGNCWVGFCGFLTSSDIPMLEQDASGTYKVAINQSKYFEKADELVTRLRELGSSNFAFFDYDYRKCSVPLTSGRSLMQVQSTQSLTSMLAYDIDFGVLPYPMYDLNQANVGYKSLQWGGYIGVLTYLKNAKMVAESLELLAFYSENVKITFYEKLLGKQVADMPDDADMLEIVWDSVTTDVGQTFITAGTTSDTGVCYTIPELLWPTTTQNLASYVKSKENAINTGFKKFLDEIKS